MEFFVEVYSKQACNCIVLVSKEYENKVWPTLEKKAVLERQVKQQGMYILQVRFDDTELPSLLSIIGYLESEHGPEQVARAFLRTIEGESQETHLPPSRPISVELHLACNLSKGQEFLDRKRYTL